MQLHLFFIDSLSTRQGGVAILLYRINQKCNLCNQQGGITCKYIQYAKNAALVGNKEILTIIVYNLPKRQTQ